MNPDSAYPLGLCLEAGSPQAAGNPLTVQQCAAADYAPQQWILKDLFELRGSNGTGPNDWRIAPAGAAVTGSTLQLFHDTKGCPAFLRDGTVGAGSAGLVAPASSAVADQQQIVNFGQLGRCVDVRRWTMETPYLHVWPCNQAPDLANVNWNQRWTMPAPPFDQGTATGQIATLPDDKPKVTPKEAKGVRYCLTSPLTSGAYPVMRRCGTESGQLWTRIARSGALTTSYLIKDSAGNCLTPTDPSVAPSDHSELVGRLAAAECDGSMRQKWNADPFILDGLPLTDLKEY